MSQINTYLALPEMQKESAVFFPTQNSFRWFIRHHRDALANAGAMICVAKRLLFKPDTFIAYVISDGQKRAVGAA